jgi:hypothetical protein
MKLIKTDNIIPIKSPMAGDELLFDEVDESSLLEAPYPNNKSKVIMNFNIDFRKK